MSVVSTASGISGSLDAQKSSIISELKNNPDIDEGKLLELKEKLAKIQSIQDFLNFVVELVTKGLINAANIKFK